MRQSRSLVSMDRILSNTWEIYPVRKNMLGFGNRPWGSFWVEIVCRLIKSLDGGSCNKHREVETDKVYFFCFLSLFIFYVLVFLFTWVQGHHWQRAEEPDTVQLLRGWHYINIKIAQKTIRINLLYSFPFDYSIIRKKIWI